MVRLALNSFNLNKILNETHKILQKGGVIVYPTDTIYGLGCDIFNANSVEKILRMKSRGFNHPMSIICADIFEMSHYACIPDAFYSMLDCQLPGPYTIILKSTSLLPMKIKSRNNTVGIRIPDSEICLSIIRNLGKPVITTSVNHSGKPALNDPDQIEKIFGNDVDLIIDVGVINSSPSTIVDLTGPTPVVIREGKEKFNIHG